MHKLEKDFGFVANADRGKDMQKKRTGDSGQLKLQFIVDAENAEQAAENAKRVAEVARVVSLGKFGLTPPSSVISKDAPQSMIVLDPRTGLIKKVRLTPDGYVDDVANSGPL